MKKKSLAALSLFLPLTILCACGSTPTQAFSANWYRDTSIRDIMSGKTEKLAYEVTFEPKDTKPLSVSYEKGTYTTELTAMAMQLVSWHVVFAAINMYGQGTVSRRMTCAPQSCCVSPWSKAAL